MAKAQGGPINEDCLNISVEGVHHLQNQNSGVMQIGGALSQIHHEQSQLGFNDRESSLNLDLIKSEMEPIDDGVSSIKSKTTNKLGKKVHKTSSKISENNSESSGRKSTAPKKPKTTKTGTISDTTSVKSSKSKAGGAKKKKKTSDKKDDTSRGGDT